MFDDNTALLMNENFCIVPGWSNLCTPGDRQLKILANIRLEENTRSLLILATT